MADAKEILKDKKVVIGGSLALLVLLAVVGFFIYNSTNGGGAAAPADSPPVAAAGAPGAPAAPGGAPGAPGSPAGAKPSAAGAPKVVAKAGPVRQTSTSFDDDPSAAPAAGAAASPAAPGGAPGAAPAAGAAGAGGGALDKLPPIRRGIREPVRQDPFISFRIPKYEEPPAFSIAAQIRIASRPKPILPPSNGITPDERLGPLPPIERRVAGVLYDGSVSAILETGTPGSAGTDVHVIQPGQTVPSGIPGIADLTVSSITPTSVLLRADDGRTVNVKLSNVPAAYADAFRQAVSQTVGGGAPQGPGGPGGPGGPPGGPGGPGGRLNIDK